MATEIHAHLVQRRVEDRLRSTTGFSRSIHEPEGEHSHLDDIPISTGNDGIRGLSSLVNSLQGFSPTKKTPIVLVAGFSGWGRPLFGTVNYWGGFEDLPATLASAGYIVIVVRIGPVSSNQERACEIYAQLTKINNATDGGYDLPTDAQPQRIAVRYSTNHPAANLGLLNNAWTWRPVLFGNVTGTWNWKWSADNPVHFICHSQGGNTVRYLVEILSARHQTQFPGDYFPTEDRQNWVKSVVTIGTPHKGTTVTDVVKNLSPPGFLEIITRAVWSASFDVPEMRIYDLQLDHWGFGRQGIESPSAMHSRLERLVLDWWNSNFHGLHDNSILGVAELETFAPNPSPHTYYFTMSFCATIPFPDELMTQLDVNSFFAMFPLNQVINPFGWWGLTLPTVFRLLSNVLILPQLIDFAKWLTAAVNRRLEGLGYFFLLPFPGTQIPRSDMLPLIAFPGYAMGGYVLDQQQSQLLGGISSTDYQPNDGIVNTPSMDGPVSAVYGQSPFPGPENDLNDMTPAKGKYWHLGENATIDHADQVGVFTVENTANEVSFMYLLFAYLVTRLQ